MSVYAEERRADRAADAEQRRIDAAAAETRRVERERAADERAARLAEQRRDDRARARQERAKRRAAWGAALTPGNVYRKGTLALVTASALGSLPAQVLHFVSISPMLLPLPLAIEGAAWVMAAGVAYADERHLPGWVRWFLRLLVLAAAGFAASINYTYGLHLPGLSATDRQAAGIGLAAVTLLGPVLFEIRQWVTTLSADTNSPEERARRRHDRLRRRQHRAIAQLADRFVSAAPFGQLDFETAFAHAWEIETGTDTPGMTPRLHERAARSAAALTRAQRAVIDPAPPRRRRIGNLFRRRPVALPTPTPNQDESAETYVNRSTADLGESAPTPITPAPVPVALPAGPGVSLVKSTDRAPVGAVAAESTRPRRATGRVPAVARSSRPARTAEQLLTEAREVAADWSDRELTAEGIRRAVHTSPAKARVLRDTLRAERAAGSGEAAA
ncbi:hypothetical protein IPZ64_32910 [Streptomyces violaceoruber]|uniref:hypothetical protein n=1 Tax=Streptomyces violaceoruber TaxID=1935 RepID=UPI0027E3C233|nr:hypothetical protein [Streptomyces violaceoruber]MCF3171645.1 hypothetical protein [Streptomyces violaceoruber]